MKSAFIALALLASPVAFANDCTPYVNPTQGGESGAAEWIYPCGKDYVVNHRACNEGEVAYDSVFNGEFYQTVAIVCHNGTFAAPARRVMHRGCAEGQISYGSKFNGEFYQSVTLVCRKGRFVRR